ncbi:MAG: Zip family zinc or iron permease [Bacteroidetes bacterium HLUCCA01]|nr:MAG: Zip family zinc or iron permease [Bacteroidetes bacterium HLUCCA01]
MNLEPYYLPFLLTLIAGLSTGVGGLMSFFSRSFNPRFLAAALGFSAGVMIYVSFVEIIPKANESLSGHFGESSGYLYTTIGFFIGILVIAIIDALIPSSHNPHEIREADKLTVFPSLDNPSKQIIRNHPLQPEPPSVFRKGYPKLHTDQLRRMGIFTALAIGIHNFPEGLATFMAAIEDPTLGISIAIAIAIHNVPEGVAIAAPMYYATRSKRKALYFSVLAGLAEPVGAVVGYVLLIQILSDAAFGAIFAGVAGIMVYISLDELLPAAEKYGEHHIAMYGLISGMAVMALSLIILQ